MTRYSQGASSDATEGFYEWRGKKFECPANNYWKPGVKSGGIAKLAAANLLMVVGNTLKYKRYLNDFSVTEIDNIWNDTATSGRAAARHRTNYSNAIGSWPQLATATSQECALPDMRRSVPRRTGRIGPQSRPWPEEGSDQSAVQRSIHTFG